MNAESDDVIKLFRTLNINGVKLRHDSIRCTSAFCMLSQKNRNPWLLDFVNRPASSGATVISIFSTLTEQFANVIPCPLAERSLARSLIFWNESVESIRDGQIRE